MTDMGMNGTADCHIILRLAITSDGDEDLWDDADDT
jgi:hypothetical protein